MPESKISKAGVFYDLKANEVVDGPVVEGYQLVPPGGEVNAEREQTIASFKAAAAAIEVAVEPDADVEKAAAVTAPARKRRA